MFPDQLKKILNLIKQTRDRVVIFDASQPDDSYVLMDFDNYSELVLKGSTFNQTSPQSQPTTTNQEEAALVGEDSEVRPSLEGKETTAGQLVNLTEEDLTDKINREISMWKNGESSSDLSEQAKARPAWRIPPQVKDKAQEVKS